MPHPLINNVFPDESIMSRIGTVAAEWSIIESLLEQLLAPLCGAQLGAMFVITRNSSSSSMVKWIKTLVDAKVDPPELAKRLDDVLTDIDIARDERNIVVHGVWVAANSPGFGTVQTIKFSRSEILRDELWSLADFDELIDHIIDLQGSIAEILFEMGILTTQK